MKYIVTVHHYAAGSGHTHSEPMDSGSVSDPFTAQAWNAALDVPFADNPDTWVRIEASFYEDNADPMFDDPIHTDECTI